ncbi:MAG: serine/threonine-protein kinase [Planctomycetota bacterium]|jgi:tetratricopeptide (TPR) repeat protein
MTDGLHDDLARLNAEAIGAIASGTPQSDDLMRRLLTASLEESPGVGEQVGPFELVELIGRGGFGEVFHARQRIPIERDVAVKILTGLDRGGSAVARFERERQVLVALRHPGIVRLLEAGITPSGHPWFAMDLVTGRTIDRWADEVDPDLDRRLGVLRDLADAVAAAHRRGVLHRDLKPSNVLVQDAPEGARVLVVDFGIAKVTASAEQGETASGHVIGTPEYMSPEAASLEPDRLDTRSDVYALGLIAFRVLAGRAALESPKGTSFATRLQLAANPRIDPLSAACATRAQARDLRGEVEWIVGRCLESDPDRRYTSAAELRDDLDRLIAREAVLAAPPSLSYQARAFLRRHRLAAATAGIAAVAVLAFAALATAFAIGEARLRHDIEIALEEEARQRDRAELALGAEAQRTEELREVADFQRAMLVSMDPAVIGSALRRTLLEQIALAGDDAAVERLESALVGIDFTGAASGLLDAELLEPSRSIVASEFAAQPLVRARLQAALAAARHALGRTEEAVELGLATRPLLLESVGPDDEELLLFDVSLASWLERLGRLGEASDLREASLPRAETAFGPTGRPTLELLLLGATLGIDGDEAALEICLETDERLASIDHDLDRPDEWNLAIRSAVSRSVILFELGRFEEALELRRRVATTLEAMPSTAEVVELMLSNGGAIARLLEETGDYPAAIAAYEASLDAYETAWGRDHPRTMVVRSDLGILLSRLGMLEQSDEILTRVLEDRLRLQGETSPESIRAMANLAVVKRRRGDFASAEVLYADAIRLAERHLEPGHELLITARANFGTMLQASGRGEEAIPLLRDALERSEAQFGREHPTTISIAGNVAVCLNQLQRYEEALPIFEEMAALSERIRGPDAVQTIIALANRSGVLRSLGRHEESLAVNDMVLERARRSLPPGHWNVGMFLMYRGRTLADLGRFGEGVEVLLESKAILDAALGPDHPRSVEGRRNLEEVHRRWEAAEPGAGHGEEADRWLKTLPSPEDGA